jgi:hypothetical protein
VRESFVECDGCHKRQRMEPDDGYDPGQWLLIRDQTGAAYWTDICSECLPRLLTALANQRASA